MRGLEEDFVLPCQVFYPTIPETPERKLMFACLADAVVQASSPTITGYSGHRPEGVREKNRAEAMAWVSSDDTTWPYSFVNCCDQLGLEPDAIRRTLRNAEAVPRISRLWGNERHKQVCEKKSKRKAA